MVAVILAGGMGTRLHPITHDRIPKVLAEVSGKPFIHWLLRYLKNQGINKVIIAVHHLADQVQTFVGDNFNGMEISYSLETIPMGTGGASRIAIEHSGFSLIWLLNGDTWFPVNLKSMWSWHQKSGNQITIAVKKLYDFNRYGSITMDPKGRITGFREKQTVKEGYINGGIYLMETEVLKSFATGTIFSLEHDLFERRVGELKMGGYKSKARFIDIGRPEDYHLIQSFKRL
jgi:D-glycero-alpha-D-manno-heptose 1-phosphate guanylyltransferase